MPAWVWLIWCHRHTDWGWSAAEAVGAILGAIVSLGAAVVALWTTMAAARSARDSGAAAREAATATADLARIEAAREHRDLAPDLHVELVADAGSPVQVHLTNGSHLPYLFDVEVLYDPRRRVVSSTTPPWRGFPVPAKNGVTVPLGRWEGPGELRGEWIDVRVRPDGWVCPCDRPDPDPYACEPDVEAGHWYRRYYRPANSRKLR